MQNNDSPTEGPSPIRCTQENADTLSMYDPIDVRSRTARQFVDRIESLCQVYDWGDKLLLFAAQSKLRGYAKMWIDSMLTVFNDFTFVFH